MSDDMWRGEVTADLKHIKEACARIEATFIRHEEHDNARFDRVDKRERWLLVKVVGVVLPLAATLSAVAYALVPR